MQVGLKEAYGNGYGVGGNNERVMRHVDEGFTLR